MTTGDKKMKLTQKNERSNGAVKRANKNGELTFERTNSNRWYVRRGDQTVFGGGHVRRNLAECHEFVKGYNS
jgi:hypothetical protein